MKLDRATSIDFGELLLEVAKNAQYITPAMQNIIAKYMDYQSVPRMLIKPTKIDL